MQQLVSLLQLAAMRMHRPRAPPPPPRPRDGAVDGAVAWHMSALAPIPSGESTKGRSVLIVPLPKGTAQYVARASGPSIVTGRLLTSTTERTLSPQISVNRSHLPVRGFRFYHFHLHLHGEYLIEVVQVYDKFDAYDTKLAKQCLRLNTMFIGHAAIAIPRPQNQAGSQDDRIEVWVPQPVISGGQWVASPVQLQSRIQYTGSVPRYGSNTPFHRFKWMSCDASGSREQCESAPCPRCPNPNMCILGGSHAQQLARSFPYQANVVNIVYADASDDYQGNPGKPVSFNSSRNIQNITERLLACRRKITLVHVGQWDFGWPGGMTPLAYFHSAFDRLLKYLQTFLPDIAVITTNINPIGIFHVSCPPGEWRTPAIIDEANKIMISVANRLRVPVIDTTDIMAPMWDRSDDWCHPDSGEVSWTLQCRMRRVVCNWHEFKMRATGGLLKGIKPRQNPEGVYSVPDLRTVSWAEMPAEWQPWNPAAWPPPEPT